MNSGKADKNFDKVRKEAEDYYSKIKEVYCPFLNGVVTFNAKGLKHINFKGSKFGRSRADRFIRLKNIRFAQNILAESGTVQEFKQIEQFETMKTLEGKSQVPQLVKYFAFVAIVKDESTLKRFKVIVKQVANGVPYFWSIIPFWKRNKELKLHSGDLEVD